MARRILDGSFKDQNGTVLVGGTVVVYLAGTTTAATIYAASSGGSAISGASLTTDNKGYFYCYVDEADYPSGQAFDVSFTKTGYSSVTYSDVEVLFQTLDAELTALASVTSAANKVPYFTGSGTATTTDLSAGGRALINLTGATNKLPYFTSSSTATTADVTAGGLALVGVTGAADKLPYFTSSSAATTTDLTSAGRALLDDVDAAAQRTTLGLGTAATQDTGISAGNVVQLDGSAKLPAVDGSQLTGISSSGGGGFKNKLIGGDFTTNPWQRGTSFTSVTVPANNDDTYLADRWYILSDGNDIIDVTRETDSPTGGIYSLRMDVETANKKFGVAQIVEYQNSVAMINDVCSLSFKAKITGTSLSNIKAGVIAWSGTADTVTSDIISSWGGDGITPTLIANATFENTPSNLGVTTSWATYKIENISVDTANTKNLIVFIWCDNATTTIGDFFYITQAQLEHNNTATAFETRSVGHELELCQRYYYRISSTGAAAEIMTPSCFADSATTAYGWTQFPVFMRSVPTNLEQTGTASNYYVRLAGGSDIVCSSVPTFNTASKWGARSIFTVASGLTAGQTVMTQTAVSAGIYLAWSAEL